MSDDLNKHCSVLSRADFEVKVIVRECLIPFPYIWASVDRVLICSTCLMMRDVVQLLVCEWLPWLAGFQGC